MIISWPTLLTLFNIVTPACYLRCSAWLYRELLYQYSLLLYNIVTPALKYCHLNTALKYCYPCVKTLPPEHGVVTWTRPVISGALRDWTGSYCIIALWYSLILLPLPIISGALRDWTGSYCIITLCRYLILFQLPVISGALCNWTRSFCIVTLCHYLVLLPLPRNSGALRDWTGSYSPSIALVAAMQVMPSLLWFLMPIAGKRDDRKNAIINNWHSSNTCYRM